jgi:nucleotide-binding universal stress UspA family protein
MSIFPTKILFATDGSRDADVAATTAVGLAKLTGSQLHVVTIAEEYPHYEAYWPLAERSRITANRPQLLLVVPSASPDEMVVKVYPPRYETTDLRASLE